MDVLSGVMDKGSEREIERDKFEFQLSSLSSLTYKWSWQNCGHISSLPRYVELDLLHLVGNQSKIYRNGSLLQGNLLPNQSSIKRDTIV